MEAIENGEGVGDDEECVLCGQLRVQIVRSDCEDCIEKEERRVGDQKERDELTTRAETSLVVQSEELHDAVIHLPAMKTNVVCEQTSKSRTRRTATSMCASGKPPQVAVVATFSLFPVLQSFR